MPVKALPIHRSALALAISAALAVGGIGVHEIGHGQSLPLLNSAVAAGRIVIPGPAALPDLAGIAERLGPAVVNISVSGTRKVSTAPAPGDDDADNVPGSQDDGMRDFLRKFQQQFGGLPPQLSLPVRGEGSGFIVRPDGLILTNAHVVQDAQEVTVKLTDRREFRAKVLGSDKVSDQ